jgi:hypothetical protein
VASLPGQDEAHLTGSSGKCPGSVVEQAYSGAEAAHRCEGDRKGLTKMRTVVCTCTPTTRDSEAGASLVLGSSVLVWATQRF